MSRLSEVFESLKYNIVKTARGSVMYYDCEGRLHREDGPAVIWSFNTREWWLNGKRHREDGPAIEYSDGRREWYLNDQWVNERDHAQLAKQPTGNTDVQPT